MRTVVGTMTGTSMDGVDAVAVNIDGHALEMTASFISMNTESLGSTQKVLQKLAANGGSQTELDAAALVVGELSLTAIETLHIHSIDLIALHGQTVFHAPPKSVQLIDVTPITNAFDCDVLTDPRQHDLLLGGQGAPITPLADWIMFRDEDESTAIVNLGGFCNVTILLASSVPEEIRGFDVCCCNLLLNTIANHHFGVEFDIGGNCALRGTPDTEVTRALRDELTLQYQSKRSLGTNDELGARALQIGNHLSPEDLLASATKAIGACITQAVSGIDRVFLAGGGVHNKSLFQAIRNHGTTQTLGVPTQAREGMAMAILGALAQDGVSITLQQVTGRKESATVVGWTQARP